jgi:hypothetical protein
VTDDFNPSEKAIKIQGGVLYLQVKDRMIWARREHPDLRVETDCIRLDEKIAVFKATVGFALDEESYHREVFGTGHGSETPQGFPPGYIEKAETVAIGRALAALGYGTAAAFEEEEGGKLADSPLQRNAPLTQHAPSLTQRVRERPTPAQDALRPIAGPGQASDAQRRRLWAITKNKWGEEAEARTRGQMWARFKVKHTTELSKGQISQLMDWIETDDLVTEEAIPQERADPVEAQEIVVSELGWELPAEAPRRAAAMAGNDVHTR